MLTISNQKIAGVPRNTLRTVGTKNLKGARVDFKVQTTSASDVGRFTGTVQLFAKHSNIRERLFDNMVIKNFSIAVTPSGQSDFSVSFTRAELYGSTSPAQYHILRLFGVIYLHANHEGEDPVQIGRNEHLPRLILGFGNGTHFPTTASKKAAAKKKAAPTKKKAVAKKKSVKRK